MIGAGSGLSAESQLRTSKIRDRPLGSIQALHIIMAGIQPKRACPLGSRRKAAFRAYKVEGSTNTLRGRVVVGWARGP